MNEGFKSGDTIFLDVETSMGMTGVAGWTNYLQGYFGWLKQTDSGHNAQGYGMGIYCSTYNCNSIKNVIDATASSLGGPINGVADVVYWVHDSDCRADTIGDGVTVNFPGSVGCFSSFSDLSVSQTWPPLAGRNGVSCGNLEFAYIWQYAQSLGDGTLPTGCGTANGYGTATEDTTHSDYCNTTPTAAGLGDYVKYRAFIDANSLDNQRNCGTNTCLTERPWPLPVIPHRYPSGAISLNSDASALRAYVTNPQQVSITQTAASLSVDVPVVQKWYNLYTSGGATIANGRIVSNTSYVDQPQVILNGDFEGGPNIPNWSSTGTAVASQSTHNGSWAIQVGSTSPSLESAATQIFTLPSSGVSDLAFAYKIVCPDSITYDWFVVTLYDNNVRTTYTVLPNTCTNTGKWATAHFDISGMLGHSVQLTFTNHDDNYAGDPTYTLIDDVALF